MPVSTTTSRAPAEGDLAPRYHDVRRFTEQLAAPLSPEDQTVQTVPEVSPTKWHRAHTTWFFETFVLPHLPGHQVVDPAYGFLFNSYYEAVGPRHARPQGLITPRRRRVAYRQAVDDSMDRLLAEGPAPEVAALVELGLHHEEQHQELLLMDIKHVLGANPLRPAYADADLRPGGGPAPPLRWIEHGGGVVEVGHPGDGFAFDNEGPHTGCCARSPAPPAWSPPRVAGVRRRRRLPRPTLWCRARCGEQLENSTAAGRHGWRSTPHGTRRSASRSSTSAGTGRRLRPVGRCRLPPGGWRAVVATLPADHRRRHWGLPPAGEGQWCGECGSGRPAPTSPTRGSGRRRARWASTAASSWSPARPAGRGVHHPPATRTTYGTSAGAVGVRRRQAVDR